MSTYAQFVKPLDEEDELRAGRVPATSLGDLRGEPPKSKYSFALSPEFNQKPALDFADQQLDALDGPQVAPTPEQEYPLLSQAIGAGENLLTLLTGATSGTVGHIAGTVAGIPKAIIDGDFGTPEGVKTIRDAATQVGGAMTYEPKTEAGKAIAGEVGDFYGEHLWPLEAAAGIAPVKAPIHPRLAASYALTPSQNAH